MTSKEAAELAAAMFVRTVTTWTSQLQAMQPTLEAYREFEKLLEGRLGTAGLIALEVNCRVLDAALFAARDEARKLDEKIEAVRSMVQKDLDGDGDNEVTH